MKEIEYTDESAPEYNQVKHTKPMRSVGFEAPKGLQSLADRLSAHGDEARPRVCPYDRCENTFDLIKGEWIAKPTGWVRLESGRLTECRCLLDRIQRAKPEAPKPSTGRLFDPILEDPEGER